jgi:hypothetical protein
VTSNGETYETWRHWSQEQVERSTIELTCPRCAEPIDKKARCAPGRWIIQAPEITRTHGYHIPWWPWPFIDLRAFANSAVSPEPAEIEELHRSDLGLAYGAGGGAITEELLLKLTAGWNGDRVEGGWRNTTMGADIGSRIHYSIESEAPDGSIHVRAMGTVTEWSGPDSLDHLMVRYQVRQAVVDAEPEMRDSDAFCRRWRGRAMRAFYPGNVNALKGVLFNIKKGTHDIQVNRTMAMDNVYAAVVGGHEVWSPQIVRDSEVVSNMEAPTRVKLTDDNGQQRYSWVHTTPDHYFHARVYAKIARAAQPNTRQFTAAVGGERPMMQAYDKMHTRIS